MISHASVQQLSATVTMLGQANYHMAVTFYCKKLHSQTFAYRSCHILTKTYWNAHLYSSLMMFPPDRSVWFSWHWFKNRKQPPIALRLSGETHTVIFAWVWRISCKEDNRNKFNSHSGIVIHNTVHKNYAVTNCKFSFICLLPGFLNMRQSNCRSSPVPLALKLCLFMEPLTDILNPKMLQLFGGNEQQSRTHITLASCRCHTHTCGNSYRHQKQLFRSFCS